MYENTALSTSKYRLHCAEISVIRVGRWQNQKIGEGGRDLWSKKWLFVAFYLTQTCHKHDSELLYLI